MKRLIGSVTALCLVLASVPQAASLESAQSALPITKRAVSKKEFIEACRKDDKKVLNVSCAKIAEAVGTRLEHKFESTEKFLEYLERLEVKLLPRRYTRLGRVMPNGTIDMVGFGRELREGEFGLFDNQLGLYILSLSCGNPITDPLPVFTAMIDDELPRPLVEQMEDAARNMTVEREEGDGFVSSLSRHKKPILIGAGAAIVGCIVFKCVKMNPKAKAIVIMK